MGRLINLSLLSLLIIMHIYLAHGTSINLRSDNNSAPAETERLQSKRKDCRQMVDHAQRSYCKISYPPRPTRTGMPMLRLGGKRASDIPRKQTFKENDYGTLRIYDKGWKYVKRVCFDYTIQKSGYYIVYLRCDPMHWNARDGISVYVGRHKTTKYNIGLKCVTHGKIDSRITSSQVAVTLCKGDVVESTFTGVVGDATEVITVPYSITKGCKSSPHLIHKIHKRDYNYRRDVSNGHYGLDYQSRPLLRADSKVTRSAANTLCQAFRIASSGVHWVMFNVNGYEKNVGPRYVVKLKRRRQREIVLYTVESIGYFQSRALAVYATKGSSIKVEGVTKTNCDTPGKTNPSSWKYQISSAYLKDNDFKGKFIYGSYIVTRPFEVSFLRFQYARFDDFVDTYAQTYNMKKLSKYAGDRNRAWYETFTAPEAGRYIISLLIYSHEDLTFKISYYDQCKKKYILFDAAFYFELLPSAQSHVLYMKKGGSFKVVLASINVSAGIRPNIPYVYKGSTLSIAWVHPM